MKCKSCDQKIPDPIETTVQWIVITFILGYILYLCVNHLGLKFWHWPELTYWDVFAGIYIFRITLLGIRNGI